MSFDDARTLFHEFGHGLHGLLSNVTYPLLAGTAVPSDFVELPSQLYEHWLEVPEILRKYALHAATGEPMPKALLDRLLATRTFDQGFATVEYTACALVDLDLHSLANAAALDVTEFERKSLERIDMPAEIVMRHRLPHFQHLFSGGGYAAGYYSYMWSEVLDADAFEAFEETGDVFDPATAQSLRDYIYSAGNLRDPAEAYKAFRGRLPAVDALLKKRGLDGVAAYSVATRTKRRTRWPAPFLTQRARRHSRHNTGSRNSRSRARRNRGRGRCQSPRSPPQPQPPPRRPKNRCRKRRSGLPLPQWR